MASTITTTGSTPGTLGNYSSPLTITSTGGFVLGSLTAPATAFSILSPGTVINHGVIDGSAGQNPAYQALTGVNGGTGVVINQGSFVNYGAVSGGHGSGVQGGDTNGGTNGMGGTGISLSGGLVTNAGNITGGTGGGDQFDGFDEAPGAAGGSGVSLTGGTLVNSGTVSGGTGTNGYIINSAAATNGGNAGIGVVIANATVNNTGEIIGGNGGVANSGGSNSRTGGAGAAGVRINSGTLINSGTIIGGSGGSGGSAGTPGANAAGLYIDGGLVIDNGSISGTAVAVSFAAAATLELGSAAHFSGSIAGFIFGDVIILETFAATSETASGGTIVFGGAGGTETLVLASGTPFGYTAGGGNTTIVGVSTITANTIGATGAAGGTGAVGGTGGNGAGLTFPGEIVNHATVTGGTGGTGGRGTISGTHGGPGGNGGNGGTGLTAGPVDIIVNTGVIIGGAGGTGGGGGYNINRGLFYGAGAGGTGGAGVYLSGAVLTNAGTISGGAGGGGGALYGIHSNTHGAAGASGNAITFGALASTLIIDPGAIFIGNIVANSAVADVLELAGTSSTAFTGLGTQFQNFAQFSFASGASWTLSGSTTNLANGPTISGFTAADAFILTGFAATSETLGSDLVLGSAGTYTTLDIPGVIDFAVVSSGGSSTISDSSRLIFDGITQISEGTAALATGQSFTGFGTSDMLVLTGFTATSETLGTSLILGQGGISETLNFTGSVDFDLIDGGGNDSIIDAPTLTFGAVTLLAGGTAALAGGQTINGFGTNDTLVLTGFTASSETIGTSLVLGNGAGSETLSFTSGTNFVLSSSGGNETITSAPTVAFGGVTLIEGGASALASGQAITGFSTGDTLLLTGFTATSETLGATLVLGNGTSSETLNISGATDLFLASDGTSETITTAPAIAFGMLTFAEAGITALAAGQTVTGFGLGDTLVMTGFAATSAFYVPGTGLELSNGATTETLNISLMAGQHVLFTTDGTSTTLTPAIPLNTLSTAVTTGFTLDNAASPYASPLSITGSGAVTGSTGYFNAITSQQDGTAGGTGGAAVKGGAADTLDNQGTLTGGTGGAGQNAPYTGGPGGTGGDALDNLAGGTFNNTGLVTGGTGGHGGNTSETSSGAGGTGGAGLSGAANETITNGETIAGGAGGGAYSGNFHDFGRGGAGGAGGTGMVLLGGVTLTNSGLVMGGAGSNGGGGSYFGGGLGGNGGAGLTAVTGDILTNTGTIAGGAAGTGGAGAYDGGPGADGTGGAGVYLNGGTLFNAGRIIGSGGADAVLFGTAAGTLIVEAGAQFTGAVIASAAAADVLEFGTGASLDLGSSFTGFTSTDILAGAQVTLSGSLFGAVLNSGTIDIAGGTSLTFASALTGAGLVIDDPSDMVFDGSVAASQTISLAGTGNTIELGDATQFNGTITGFGAGDTLIIDGFTAASASYAAGTLVLDGSSGTSPEALTLDLAGGFTSAEFTLSSNTSGGTDVVLCFYPGTRIATPQGKVAVEDLRAGMLVETANGPLPVRWLGRSHVATRFADKMRVLPIRISAGALGSNLPARDLLLSPDHAIFMDDVLIQANALVNGTSIFREHNVPECFSYYHVELASHELLLAEGVQAESFVDNVDRMNFANWDERTTPDEPILEMPYPRVKARRQLPAHFAARFAA